jgi:hypothetical protein
METGPCVCVRYRSGPVTDCPWLMTVVDDQVEKYSCSTLCPVYCTVVAIVVHCPYARCVITVDQSHLRGTYSLIINYKSPILHL